MGSLLSYSRVATTFSCLLFLTIVSPALADESIIAAPGEATIVKQVKGAVKEAAAEHGGTVLTSDSKTVPPVTSIIYMPPDGVKQLDDVVRYKVGDVQQTPIPVSVRARAPTLSSPGLYDASFKAIFVLFILAVLVESGLTLLFRWRPFLDYFDSRSTNSLIAFALSLTLVRMFDLDIASRLIGIYSENAKASQEWFGWPGSILTAMIIAGGSAGVNRIFQSFGFRPTSDEGRLPPPDLRDDQAWIAVTLIRKKAVGPATVLIGSAAAGTISGASPKFRLARYFVRDKGRFPQTGGFTVKPGTGFEVQIKAFDASGADISSRKWGPYDIAPRAIIDVEMIV